ncbi:MAG: glycerate kinase [Gammaproteobacteria bacterium]|nr:glycerate kinase [Gammaproteobacteria bacterium]
MKIVIASDSFKGNLTSLQVADAIEKGIRRVVPDAVIVKVPMADGGEGTVRSLVDATGGRIVTHRVRDPLGKEVTARYGILGDKKTAVIEMAEASGLPLVPRGKRNPLKTTTFGTGQLIVDALDHGVRKIVIGIGGSATVDGGAGMAQALGVTFRGQDGRVMGGGCTGGMLSQISAIDIRGIDPRIAKTTFVVACDVDNPLTGKKGAAAVFGPQKGASAAMVKQLDEGLRHLAFLIRRDLGVNVQRLPGAGAAGGLGAGLVAFTGAELKRGVDIVIEATGLLRHIKGADLVMTGEGRIDFQTVFGKTPAGVAQAAKRTNVPVIAIGGGLADDARGVFAHGIDGLESATAREMELDEAIKRSRTYLANAAERVMRLVFIGKTLSKKRV